MTDICYINEKVLVYHSNWLPKAKACWKKGRVKKINFISDIGFMSYIYDVEIDTNLHPVNHEFVFKLSNLSHKIDKDFLDDPFKYFCKQNNIEFGLLTFGKDTNAKLFGQTSYNEKIFLNLTSDN